MKFQPITVTLTIKADDLYDVAQMAIDALDESFTDDVVEMAGVDQQELFDAIMQDSTFRTMIADRVKEYGAEFISDPWGYIDGYDFLETIPGLIRVVDLCREMDNIILDANESENETECIPVPKGYKLVRI